MTSATVTTPGHGKIAVAFVPFSLDEQITITLVDVRRQTTDTASSRYHAVSSGSRDDGSSDFLVGSVEEAQNFPYYRLAIVRNSDANQNPGSDEIILAHEVIYEAEQTLEKEDGASPFTDKVTPRILAIQIRKMIDEMDQTDGETQTVIVVPDAVAAVLYDADAAPQQTDGVNAPHIARTMAGFPKPSAHANSEDITPIKDGEPSENPIAAVKALSGNRLIISRTEAAFNATMGDAESVTRHFPDGDDDSDITVISIEEKGHLFRDEATVTVWSVTKTNEGASQPYTFVPLDTINANFEDIEDDQVPEAIRQIVSNETGVEIDGTIIAFRTQNDGTSTQQPSWEDDDYDMEMSRSMAQGHPWCTAALAVLTTCDDDRYQQLIDHITDCVNPDEIVAKPYPGQFTHEDEKLTPVTDDKAVGAEQKYTEAEQKNSVNDLPKTKIGAKTEEAITADQEVRKMLSAEAERRGTTGDELKYFVDDKYADKLLANLRAVGVDLKISDVDLKNSEIVEQVFEPLKEAMITAHKAAPTEDDEAPNDEPASDKNETGPEQISEKQTMGSADIATAVAGVMSATEEEGDEEPLDPNTWKGRAYNETAHLVDNGHISAGELSEALTEIDNIMIDDAKSDTANEEVTEHFLTDLIDDIVLRKVDGTAIDAVAQFLTDTAKLHPALFIAPEDASHKRILAVTSDWKTSLFDNANGNDDDADTDTISIKVHIMVAAMTWAISNKVQNHDDPLTSLVDEIKETNTDIGDNKKKTPENLFGTDKLLPENCQRWVELDVAHLLDAISRRYSEKYDTYTDSGSLGQVDYDPQTYKIAVEEMDDLWRDLAKDFKAEHGDDPKDHIKTFINKKDKYGIFVDDDIPFNTPKITQNKAKLTATAVRAHWRNHHARLVLAGEPRPATIDKDFIRATALKDAKKRVLDEHIEIGVWLAEHHEDLVNPDAGDTTEQRRGSDGPQSG